MAKEVVFKLSLSPDSNNPSAAREFVKTVEGAHSAAEKASTKAAASQQKELDKLVRTEEKYWSDRARIIEREAAKDEARQRRAADLKIKEIERTIQAEDRAVSKSAANAKREADARIKEAQRVASAEEKHAADVQRAFQRTRDQEQLADRRRHAEIREREAAIRETRSEAGQNFRNAGSSALTLLKGGLQAGALGAESSEKLLRNIIAIESAYNTLQGIGGVFSQLGQGMSRLRGLQAGGNVGRVAVESLSAGGKYAASTKALADAIARESSEAAELAASSVLGTTIGPRVRPSAPGKVAASTVAREMAGSTAGWGGHGGFGNLTGEASHVSRTAMLGLEGGAAMGGISALGIGLGAAAIATTAAAAFDLLKNREKGWVVSMAAGGGRSAGFGVFSEAYNKDLRTKQMEAERERFLGEREARRRAERDADIERTDLRMRATRIEDDRLNTHSDIYAGRQQRAFGEASESFGRYASANTRIGQIAAAGRRGEFVDPQAMKWAGQDAKGAWTEYRKSRREHQEAYEARVASAPGINTNEYATLKQAAEEQAKRASEAHSKYLKGQRAYNEAEAEQAERLDPYNRTARDQSEGDKAGAEKIEKRKKALEELAKTSKEEDDAAAARRQALQEFETRANSIRKEGLQDAKRNAQEELEFKKKEYEYAKSQRDLTRQEILDRKQNEQRGVVGLGKSSAISRMMGLSALRKMAAGQKVTDAEAQAAEASFGYIPEAKKLFHERARQNALPQHLEARQILGANGVDEQLVNKEGKVAIEADQRLHDMAPAKRDITTYENAIGYEADAFANALSSAVKKYQDEITARMEEKFQALIAGVNDKIKNKAAAEAGI